MPSESHQPDVSAMAETWIGKVGTHLFKNVRSSKSADKFDEVFAELVEQ